MEELFEEALSETENPCEGDYIRFQCGGYEIKVTKEKTENSCHYNVQLIPKYYTYLVQEEQVNEWVKEILSSLQIEKTKKEIEKIEKIYHYVYENVAYDTVHQNKKNAHLKATAYAALKYHTVVCQGYAVLIYRLLKETGIRARVITGNILLSSGKREYHAWNIVEADGKFYNLDVTWDRAKGTEECFMKAENDFLNHQRKKEYATKEFMALYPMAEESYYK